jgi:hypothetical protein
MVVSEFLLFIGLILSAGAYAPGIFPEEQKKAIRLCFSEKESYPNSPSTTSSSFYPLPGHSSEVGTVQSERILYQNKQLKSNGIR